jgi:hypothetical protein
MSGQSEAKIPFVPLVSATDPNAVCREYRRADLKTDRRIVNYNEHASCRSCRRALDITVSPRPIRGIPNCYHANKVSARLGQAMPTCPCQPIDR